MLICHYHGYRIYTHPLGLEAGIAELVVAGVTHIGCPYQHHAERYVAGLRETKLRIVYTVGAHERPPGLPFGWNAWDCEGGGDPQDNARWWRHTTDWYNNIVYSGYPGIRYSGQTIQTRYGCDWQVFNATFSCGFAHPMPWPIAACGGVRGLLPPTALDGMPAVLPVLHAITPPDWQALQAQYVDHDAYMTAVEADIRATVRDRLSWVQRWPAGGGLMLVQAHDGEAGARWTVEDSLQCRVLAEELCAIG